MIIFSCISIRGSTVEAGKSAVLFADNAITLEAAKNTAGLSGTSQSSSGSIGISYGTSGWMLNLSASAGKGKEGGNDESYANTEIRGGNDAGNAVVISSGGDTTLKGAVARANQIQANVGGNLNIESLQDTSTYASKNQNVSGSLSIGFGNMSGSASASASKVDADFRSVTEQSGLKAGDGGFQVSVGGNTDLKGAVIASNQAAVDNNLNSFTTGGQLTTSDIQNTASYSGKSLSLSGGAGYSNGNASMNGAAPGFGSDKGSANSTTSSGISNIAANTAVRSTDPKSGICRIFDAATVQKEIDAQTRITQYFGQQASKAVGEYAQKQMAGAIELRAKASIETDPVRAAELRAQADTIEANWGTSYCGAYAYRRARRWIQWSRRSSYRYPDRAAGG